MRMSTTAKVITVNGDATDFDPDEMFGPDVKGRRWRIVKAEFTPMSNTTYLHLKPVTPQEFRERLEARVPMERDRHLIKALFGG